MLKIGDLVRTTIDNPLDLMMYEEVGTVKDSYFKGTIQHVRVLFPEYGDKQGFILSSLYEKIDGVVNEKWAIKRKKYEEEIMQATHFIQTQKIYAKLILNT